MFNKNNLLYFDYAAATPLDKKVATAMEPYFFDLFFNPSAPYIQAVKVRRDYNNAKDKIARLIGGRKEEIVITAGATESINLALKSYSGKVLVSPIEHKSVLDCLKGRSFEYIDINKDGVIDLKDLESKIDDNVEVISVGLANNEIGTIQPLRKIAEIVRRKRIERAKRNISKPILLHSDASQGLPVLDVNVARLGVDMLTLNAAKVYGPKQVGLLWFSSNVRLKPVVSGGGQEMSFRSGTENVAGTIGFSKAIEIAKKKQNSEAKRLEGIKRYFRDSLSKEFPEIIFSGSKNHSLSSILHFSLPGLDAERLVFRLENRGVMVATGSACAANSNKRSHVLKAIGATDAVCDGSIRLSFGRQTTSEIAEGGLRVIVEEIKSEYERVDY